MTEQAGASVPWLRVSVVIPALNEARNLPHVFARLPPDVHEVIVVDGLSVDDTIAVARQLRPGVRIVLQSRRGKGNALACGFAAATARMRSSCSPGKSMCGRSAPSLSHAPS